MGEPILDALRHAHGCPPGCAACIAEAEEARRPGLERFLPAIVGDVGLRLGRAKALLGLDLPRVSHDELEQFLFEEAVMTRWHEHARVTAEQSARDAERYAAGKAAARDRLAAHKRGAG